MQRKVKQDKPFRNHIEQQVELTLNETVFLAKKPYPSGSGDPVDRDVLKTHSQEEVAGKVFSYGQVLFVGDFFCIVSKSSNRICAWAKPASKHPVPIMRT